MLAAFEGHAQKAGKKTAPPCNSRRVFAVLLAAARPNRSKRRTTHCRDEPVPQSALRRNGAGGSWRGVGQRGRGRRLDEVRLLIATSKRTSSTAQGAALPHNGSRLPHALLRQKPVAVVWGLVLVKGYRRAKICCRVLTFDHTQTQRNATKPTARIQALFFALIGPSLANAGIKRLVLFSCC
jgi:hypothetical protein